MIGPLLTREVHDTLVAAARAGATAVDCSLDLGRSTTTAEPGEGHWTWQGQVLPYLERCKERTVYHWTGRQEPREVLDRQATVFCRF